MSAPLVKVINGTGRPRIEVVGSTEYTSVNSPTYTSSSVTEPLGSTKAISTSDTSYPCLVTTGVSHGLNVGDWVYISGHSQSALNGTWRVTLVPGSTQFRVDTALGAGGTGGTAQYSPAFVSRGLRENQRVQSTDATVGDLTWGRIAEVTSETFMYIYSWSNGTPSNGTTFIINGFMVDLPRCQDINLRFTPVQNEKILLRNRVKTEFEGYWLEATLDYSRFIVGDDLINLKDILNPKPTDQLMLIPHIDESKYEYNVYLSRPLDLAPFGRGHGHKRFVMTFSSNELVEFPETAGYGFGYGTDYGNQL